MEMVFLNCRCCGGELDQFSNLCICKHCGATNFISDVANKNVIQLNRANKLRQENEFDNAARIYDKIIEENGPTADILWYRTLCEYGIEYVPDPVSDKYFPTLHRISDESILECDFFKQAYELADEEHKETLAKEAEYINDVQTRYLNIAADEDPYDVFICYKETDLESGGKTDDVLLAEELYNDLTGRGYKVFFARETLKEKLSIDYEPYIFAALKSANAMAVIGTKAEYFTAVWVKNEWGRFLKLMKNNPNKQMFFACDDPEELPRAFASKQAQLIGEEGAIRNLAKNIDDFLKQTALSKKFYSDKDRESMYNEALSLLDSEERNNAKDLIDKIISQYPNYANGYWLRMLYNHNATTSSVKLLPVYLFADSDFNMAFTLADKRLKAEYSEIAAVCNENLKHQNEFSKIVKEKSAEYVDNFDESEMGRAKESIIATIRFFCSEVDSYSNRIKYTFVAGYSLLYIGLFLFFIISARYGSTPAIYFMADPSPLFKLRNTITAIAVLLGLAIGLSFNPGMDLVLTGISALLFAVSIFVFPIQGFWWILMAVFIPVFIYCCTVPSYSANKNVRNRTEASRQIERELKKLNQLINIDAKAEMKKNAEEYLEKYKEDNKIDALLEIKEADFIQEMDRLDNTYEFAEEEYKQYIAYAHVNDKFDPEKEKEKEEKKESVLGIIAGILLLFMIGISPILAIVDLLIDKKNKYRHSGAMISLFLSIPFMTFFCWVANLDII